MEEMHHNDNFKKAVVETGSTIEQKNEEVKNLMEKFEDLYYAAGVVTSSSQFARSEENTEGRERPLFVRAHRADIYHKIKNLDKDEGGNVIYKDEREKLIKEAHVRDNIAEQYLNQKELKMNIPEYGDLSARMVDIVPPESLLTEKNKDLPPIFLIPGISNDLECMNNMASELVMQGRRVVMVAHPESVKGHATKEFAEAVGKDEAFGPHSEFFGEAIKHIFKDEKSFELWGFSIGGAISAQLLKDPEFQEKVKKAVLVCPAGFTEQSSLSLKLGLLQDMAVMKNKKSVHLLWGYGHEKNEQFKLHDQIMASLIRNITKANENWKGARVQEGGSILVVNGKKDMVTKSIKMSPEYTVNPQMHVLDLPNAYHMTPQTEAETIIPQILKEQW